MRKQKLLCAYPNNLKQYRRPLGYDRSTVAHFIGLTKAKELVRWEKGISTPDLVSLFKLSVIYKATPFELYRELVQKIVDEIHKQPSKKPLPTIQF